MSKTPNILKQFTPWRILVPVVIGLSISGYMIFRNFEADAFAGLQWSLGTVGWLIAAAGMVFVKEGAYMYRIRLLTDFQLSWPRSAVIILLWEFASAVTPSIVGGTAFALVLLAKEGISPGKSTALVLLTAFLDELFFVATVPLFLLIVGYGKMFEFLDRVGGESDILGMGLTGVFWVGYIILAVYTLLLAYGLFVNPGSFASLINWIFRLRILKRWKEGALQAGRDIIVASGELKGKNSGFWLKAFGATVLTWSSRYFIINCLLAAFAFGAPLDHFIIYARQIFMWVILLIPVTPGGAGLAEFMFGEFLGEFIQNEGMINPIGLLWRMYGYYPFLVIGAVLLPRWLRNKFGKQPPPGPEN